MKLIAMLEAVADADRDRPAIVTPERTLTYRGLHHAVASLVCELGAAGVRAGDRVVAITDHDERAIALVAAASAIGARLMVPYNLEAAAEEEWVSMTRAARPDHVIVTKRGEATYESLRRAAGSILSPRIDVAPPGGRETPLVVAAPDAIRSFFILFSSGTTGNPKAISVSEKLIATRVARVTKRLGFDSDARVLLCGLVNNTTGIIFGFGAFLHGAKLVVPAARAVESWPAEVERHRITHLMLRPAAMRRFLAAAKMTGADLSSLRTVAYGAAALSARTLTEARSVMKCDFVQGYGLSETFGPFSFLMEEDHRAGRHEASVYCVGTPDSSLEVSISGGAAPGNGTVGEVRLRGDALMDGYYDVATDRIQPVGEWFSTGDYGAWSERGEIILKGRVANTILSENGHRIYPEEVEGTLTRVAGVADAVLLEWATEMNLGSPSVLCFSGALAGGAPDAARSAVLSELERSLSREKWPAFLYPFADGFPMSSNGKVVRAELLRRIEPARLIPLHAENVAA